MMKTHDHLYNHVRLCEIPLFHKILPAKLRNAINTLTCTEAVSKRYKYFDMYRSSISDCTWGQVLT